MDLKTWRITVGQKNQSTGLTEHKQAFTVTSLHLNGAIRKVMQMKERDEDILSFGRI